MSELLVEDGGGNPNSNAYISVEFADQWHDNMGHAFWSTLTRNQKISSIVRATMYLDQRFKRRYRGLRQSVEQGLGWPRIGAFDDDAFTIFGVPYQVERASAEYALRAAYYNQLAPDPVRTVPPQNFNVQPPTQTPGTATYTGTGNFNDGDVVLIGVRSYTMQTVLTSVDGHVLIGGTLAASLNNLASAINFTDNYAMGKFTGSVNFSNGDTVVIGGNNGQKTYTMQTVLTMVNGNVRIGSSLSETLANLAAAINNFGNNGADFYCTNGDQNVTAVPGPTTLLVTARLALDVTAPGVSSPLNVALSANTAAGAWGSAFLEVSGALGVLYYVTQADPNVTAALPNATSMVASSTVPNANNVAVAYTPFAATEGAWSAATITGYSYTGVQPDIIVGPVRSKTEKVGPLEEATTYDGLAQLSQMQQKGSRSVQSTMVNDIYLPEYPEADMWLEQVLRNPSTGTRLIRGS